MDSAHAFKPDRCAELIRHSRSIVALTGAGLSTAAGIPDFRGPKGIYVTKRYDPEKVFEIDWFRRAPEYFYEFSSDFVTQVKNIRPTFTHQFLANMEKEGRLAAVITQNIDMLHQLAGSQKVIEFHGSYRTASCVSCSKRYEELTYARWEKAMISSPTPPIPRCSACNGVLKPDIVFFGETVNGYREAERLVAECDLLLVLGSSLRVYPASSLPELTEAPTVVVNQGEVALSPASYRFFVNTDLDEYFLEVAGHR